MMKENTQKSSTKLNLKNFTSVCSSKDINNLFINTLIMEDEPFRLLGKFHITNFIKTIKKTDLRLFLKLVEVMRLEPDILVFSGHYI